MDRIRVCEIIPDLETFMLENYDAFVLQWEQNPYFTRYEHYSRRTEMQHGIKCSVAQEMENMDILNGNNGSRQRQTRSQTTSGGRKQYSSQNHNHSVNPSWGRNQYPIHTDGSCSQVSGNRSFAQVSTSKDTKKKPSIAHQPRTHHPAPTMSRRQGKNDGSEEKIQSRSNDHSSKKESSADSAVIDEELAQALFQSSWKQLKGMEQFRIFLQVTGWKDLLLDSDIPKDRQGSYGWRPWTLVMTTICAKHNSEWTRIEKMRHGIPQLIQMPELTQVHQWIMKEKESNAMEETLNRVLRPLVLELFVLYNKQSLAKQTLVNAMEKLSSAEKVLGTYLMNMEYSRLPVWPFLVCLNVWIHTMMAQTSLRMVAHTQSKEEEKEENEENEVNEER